MGGSSYHWNGIPKVLCTDSDQKQTLPWLFRSGKLRHSIKISKSNENTDRLSVTSWIKILGFLGLIWEF